MAFLDKTGEQTIERGNTVLVGDYGTARVGVVVKTFMALEGKSTFWPCAAVRFRHDDVPVIYSCSALLRVTVVGMDQWVRMDSVPPDALPSIGDTIMVLSKQREYRLAEFDGISKRGVHFFVDGQRYVGNQETSFVRFYTQGE